MKKKSFALIYIIYNSFFVCTSICGQVVQKGLIEVFSTYHNENVEGKPRFSLQSYKIWFKDSAVIYETRINTETSTSTPVGIQVKKSFPVWKYTFLNLKTMKCQDYLDFESSSLPVNNYFLKENENVGWKFYANKNPKDTLDKMKIMSDTIISKVLYKRIELIRNISLKEKNYFISYLQYTPKRNIFHLGKILEELFPAYKTMMTESLDTDRKIIGKFGYKIIKDTLNGLEERVFNHWHKNSLYTKLPLLTFAEIQKIPIRTPEHENPTITLVPKE